MVDQRPLAVFLMGPTASGKTALACALSERFRLGLVSVDSALVYRGLDIGAAKPDAATLARHPHELIDIREPTEPYSAAQFAVDASAAMRGIRARGATPLLVGGTGLYFRALQAGLSELPAADPALRESISSRARVEGWPALHARLAQLDASAAARIRPGDAQRIQRALEVIELTGRPLSALHGRQPKRFDHRVLKLALLPSSRQILHGRIAERVDAMLAAGLVDEVRSLAGRDRLADSLPALRAVGYRQTWQHLRGDFGLGELRDRIVFATRQLAKRQTTWLRSELDARPVDPFAPEALEIASAALGAFLGEASSQT